MATLVQLSDIGRSFGAIHALKGVDFEIGRGEVMGLVGENGAGKSTLVKIISGFDDDYTGKFKIDGEEVRFSSPARAERAGIAVAQQELSLIPAMSVAENIMLAGDRVPVIATKRGLASRAMPFLEQVGLGAVDPMMTVNRLSVGEQQLVEVARLLAHDPQVLILDEPTAALGERDSVRILEMVQRLAANGKSIIYVSHRMDEIFRICDRITVLRDGESSAPRPAPDLDVHSLVHLMLGRELGEHVSSPPSHPAGRAAPRGPQALARRWLWKHSVSMCIPAKFSALRVSWAAAPAMPLLPWEGRWALAAERLPMAARRSFLVRPRRPSRTESPIARMTGSWMACSLAGRSGRT